MILLKCINFGRNNNNNIIDNNEGNIMILHNITYKNNSYISVLSAYKMSNLFFFLYYSKNYA